MKNSKDVYGAQGKTNVLAFDPEHLVLVEDPKHPLFDERVKLPFSEATVLNMMFQGVLEPVIITKNTETGAIEVVDGRQRVKAAREANKRLKAKGCEPILVPGIVRRGDGASLAGVMVSTNELRAEDTPINRAKKMQRLVEMGRTEEQLSVIFGCSVPTVKNTLALLDCCAAVRAAVDAGKINVSVVYQLARLPADEQKEKLDKVLSVAGKGRGRKVREALGQTPSIRSRKQINTLRDSGSFADLETAKVALAVLAWVLGDDRALAKFTKKAA